MQASDEIGDIAITRHKSRQSLGIFERCDEISGIAAEGDERQKRVAILRMPGQVFLEHGNRLFAATGGMQRDRIDICVSRAIGFELGCAAQFGHCLIGPFEPGQS